MQVLKERQFGREHWAFEPDIGEPETVLAPYHHKLNSIV